MIIDLTYHCSMGCTHCMSSCKPDGQHMKLETLKDALEFCKKNKIPTVSFSGGEIFEHPQIKECLELVDKYYPNVLIGLTTNGRKLAADKELLEFMREWTKKRGKKNYYLQVTDDARFYPTRLSQKERYNLEKLGAIVEGVPTNQNDNQKCLYPQGRALENFDEGWWNTLAPKCVNARLSVKQGVSSFKGLVDTFASMGKFCTPMIDPYGNIKIGESAHCPAIATIYDSDKEIIEKIANCKCTACKIPLEIFKKQNPLGYALFMS